MWWIIGGLLLVAGFVWWAMKSRGEGLGGDASPGGRSDEAGTDESWGRKRKK